ncbi:MAG TPA: sialidase family protein [Mycobacteriales bacterium]|nr:sialidase family protein [Mycobacteriales bacterium]
MSRLATARWAAAALAAAGAAVLAVPTQAAPRTSWEKPVLVHAQQASRETSLAIDPTDSRRQFVCDPSGVPDVFDGQSYFHVTNDGGHKWKPIRVEGTVDSRQAAFEGGDCDVAYDAGGTMYTADTWLGNLSIGHSTDRGETWQGTAVSGTSPVIDRPWLVGGKKGTLYVSYQDLQCCTPAAMWFMKSTDYGQTFTPAVPITTALPSGLYTWEGNFVVAPNGNDLTLVYSRRTSGAVSVNDAPASIWVARSHDGGQTWNSTLVASIPKETTSIYPAIGLDAGGILHVVWCAPAAKGNPVSYTSSADGGKTWRKPVALNPGKVGVAPWVAGGAKGHAAVVWLGSPDPAATDRTDSPWYFSYAKVSLSSSGKPTIETGNTTTKPVYEGRQTTPEFEMVRLDKRGKMHLGMSVFRNGAWALYTQNEK